MAVTSAPLRVTLDGRVHVPDGGRSPPARRTASDRTDAGVGMAVDSPPTYAWDWLARQRVALREIRRRLLTAQRDAARRPGSTGARDDVRMRAIGDVPDWSADHPDLRHAPRMDERGADLDTGPGAGGVGRAEQDGATAHDYRTLDTRAEVIAALRMDYASDAEIRRTVDAVVAEIAFLGRLDVSLHELGVRTAPRGMRWWWCHLGGSGSDDRSAIAVRDERHPTLPTQLRLVDVLAGYGDVREA